MSPASAQSDDARKLSDLETTSIGRLLLRYSIPAVVGMVVMSLYNVIDRIYIGQGVGTDAIAGLAITFPVMNLSAAVGILIGAGASARVSILLGARRLDDAMLVLGNSLTLTLINATCYILLFGVFMDPVLRAFGASDNTLPYARDFMMWLLPGMLFTNLAFSFNNIMRASGYPARAMFTMFIGAGINVALAPIFIFWLDMGIKGAAIATDIAMACSAWFVMRHFIRRESTLHFQRGIYRLKSHVIYAIISIGAAPSLVNFAACGINVILNRSLAEYGGDTAIAAAGIFSTYASLLTMVVVGICQGMQPIVGYNYGAGRTDRLSRAFMLATMASTVICTTGAVFGMLCPHWIARAFTTDASLIQITSHTFHLVFRMFWVVGFQIIATSFFQSIGKAGRSIFLSLSRQVIFLIPLLLWLPRHYGLDGVWLSFPGSDILATVVTLILVVLEFRKLRNN